MCWLDLDSGSCKDENIRGGWAQPNLQYSGSTASVRYRTRFGRLEANSSSRLRENEANVGIVTQLSYGHTDVSQLHHYWWFKKKSHNRCKHSPYCILLLFPNWRWETSLGAHRDHKSYSETIVNQPSRQLNWSSHKSSIQWGTWGVGYRWLRPATAILGKVRWTHSQIAHHATMYHRCWRPRRMQGCFSTYIVWCTTPFFPPSSWWRNDQSYQTFCYKSERPRYSSEMVKLSKHQHRIGR